MLYMYELAMRYINFIQTDVLFLFIVLLTSSSSVKITRLQVPDIIGYGDPVLLDCDFTLDENDTDVVVKWFFNETLVYQWIPGSKNKPQGLGVLKDRLNLEYAASLEASSKYRALNIVNVGLDLSGEYTCSVFTLQSEDIRTKNMVVLGNNGNLNYNRRWLTISLYILITSEGVTYTFFSGG